MRRNIVSIVFAGVIALSFSATPSFGAADENPHVANAEHIMSRGFGLNAGLEDGSPYLTNSGDLENGYPVIIGLARDYIESARADGVDVRQLENKYRHWLHASLEEHAFGSILLFVSNYASCQGLFKGLRGQPETAAYWLDEGIREVYKMEDIMIVSGVSLHRIAEFRRTRDAIFSQMRTRYGETARSGTYCPESSR